MFNNIFSISTFIFLIAYINLIRTYASIKTGEIKKTPLEKIILYSVFSLIGIVAGFFQKIDPNILFLEIFSWLALTSYILIFLNSSHSPKIYGQPVPGYSAPEEGFLKILKYFFLSLIIILILGLVLFFLIAV